MPLEIFESYCSTQELNCATVLKSTLATSSVDAGAAYWQLEFTLTSTAMEANVDPFARDVRRRAELAQSVVAFLYGQCNETMPISYWLNFPSVWGTLKTSLPWNTAREKWDLHYAGTSPAIKFITLEGVTDVNTSAGVYFAPFTSTVWAIVLASLGAIFLLEMFMVKGQGLPLHLIAYELLFWKFSSFLGQYYKTYYDPPLLLSPLGHQREQKQVSKGIIITATAWFIAGILILSNNGAFFSAESLHTFPYTTRYMNFMQLENFTLYFLLPDRKYPEFFSETVSEMVEYECVFNELAGFEIRDYILEQRLNYESELREMKQMCQLASTQCTDASSETEKKLKILNIMAENFHILISNPRTAEKMV